MYHVKIRPTPFIPDLLYIKRSLFAADYCAVTIRELTEKGITGHSVHSNVARALKAAAGEHIERTSLYINTGNFPSDKTKGFNLATGELVEIPTSHILLSRDSKVFQNSEPSSLGFSDSSGVASHLNSYSTIKAAFLEFFERQSLVYNWITQSPGCQVQPAEMENHLIQTACKKASHFVDELYFIDISIHPDLHVILALGFGEHYMGLGIAADWDLEEAVISSLDELFQCFGFLKNKNYTEPTEDLQRRDNKRDNREVDPHYYSNYFHSHFTPKKLKEAYDYLLKSNKTKTNKQKLPLNLAERIARISNDLNIQIIGCFIPTVKRGIKTKIIKVLSPEGYPHMNTSILNPEEYAITHSLGATHFPNMHQMLPFP